MKLLMDSSTDYLFLALYDETKKEVHDTLIRNGKHDHSETLIDNLHLLLEKNHITCDDVDAILVGRGPGSYTGVRISGTIAKVLALIKEKQLYSFSTLDLLLSSKINEEGTYLARITAKKNHSYYKVAKVTNQTIEYLTSDLFGLDEEVLAPYQNIKERGNFIEVNDDLFINAKLLAKTIVENHLYQEEDIYTYVPNYLRSEING